MSPFRPWHIELRDARRSLGVSQREVERRTGVRQAHLSRIESGLLDPKLSCVVQLSRAVGLECVLVPRRTLPAVAGMLRDFGGGGDDGGGRRRTAVELLVGNGENG